jgi:hypothetical protein
MLKQTFSKQCNHKWIRIDSLGWSKRCTECDEYQIQQITKEGIEQLNPKLTEWVLLKEGNYD